MASQVASSGASQAASAAKGTRGSRCSSDGRRASVASVASSVGRAADEKADADPPRCTSADAWREGVTDVQLQEFREIFDLVDTDRGGSIGCEELAQLMETLGIRCTTEELEIMVAEIDENGNGEIEFEEFVQVMRRKMTGDYTRQQVSRAFRFFAGDVGDGGDIKLKELEAALCCYGRDRMTPEEARDLVSKIECPRDGVFKYDDYISMMMTGR